MNRRTFLSRRPARKVHGEKRGVDPQQTNISRGASLKAPRVSSGLEPYTGPWEIRQAAHLVRRTHFGLSRAGLISALTSTTSQAADAIVDAALNRPLPDTPTWYNQTDNGQNLEWTYEWQEGWYAEMRTGGLREWLTLMWHDHFATEANVYYHAAFAYQYVTYLRQHALGDFRDALRGIGLVPAMLIYLNGDQNTEQEPNENYAREVMELFSMGIQGPDGTPNYTQQDIAEVARALTGWVVNMNTLESEFVPSRHDSDSKTIFGQTGNYDYHGFIDLLFQQRSNETAHFIASKLYSWFVYPIPNSNVVNQLKNDLLNNGFSIEHAVRRLLKSAHFYEGAFIGARIKSPTEFMVGVTRELSITPTGDMLSQFREIGFSLGQDVLNPPNVAGWPGYAPDQYRSWITTGTVPDRSSLVESAVNGGSGFEALDTLALAGDISDPTDAEAIVTDFVTHLLPTTVHAEVHDHMLEILMQGSPVWEWVVIYNQDPDSAASRLRDLLSFIMNLPEYQLT